ncbi:MAG: aspartyl/glutamyl-tRNA amidotransferase subunit A [Candidatus Micrarchaeota archaeon]|nr:aspartyl/glutamyl-tRNA amidotransferase subunit A [Candidatus Micrarchaeota archaeon]
MVTLIQTVSEHVKAAKDGNVDITEFLHKTIEESKRIQLEYSPFITLNEHVEMPKSEGMLYSLPVSVKDCICTNGIRTTAGSKVLDGYVPPFDATCVSKAKDAGAFILGKTAQDEFGFGTFSINCSYSVPKNPIDKSRTCGGSSGGAACLTAASSFPHMAIAESTGGSITAPAAFTGTVGLTPTYGIVSRYGLIDYSNSMDKIGIISKSVEDAALGLSIISGYDPLDSTSVERPSEDYTRYVHEDVKKLRVGVPKEYFTENVDERISKLVLKRLEQLQSLGIQCKETSLPLTKYALPAYYLIAMSEASTNLAKYCGLRYGKQEQSEDNFDSYFSRIRSGAFGEEAKRRIILGTYARMAGFRDAYYLKALKVRSLIIKEFKNAFKDFDALITPSMPILPPTFSDIGKLTPAQTYAMDVLTTPANLACMPTISVPIGLAEGLPVGIQIISNHFCEGKTIALGSAIEGLK